MQILLSDLASHGDEVRVDDLTACAQSKPSSSSRQERIRSIDRAPINQLRCEFGASRQCRKRVREIMASLMPWHKRRS
jgi:hypothetical protein